MRHIKTLLPVHVYAATLITVTVYRLLLLWSLVMFSLFSLAHLLTDLRTGRFLVIVLSCSVLCYLHVCTWVK